MGKYSNTFTQKELPKKNQTHEIWKGLGCLIMLLIPAISIASASETVKWILTLDGKRIIPSQLLGIPRPPDFVYKSDGLLLIFKSVTGFENFYAIAILSLLFILVLSGLISMVYAAVYSRVAPNRYGPLDAPPQKIRVNKKSR